jgi:hypothetical protein
MKIPIESTVILCYIPHKFEFEAQKFTKAVPQLNELS